MAPTPFFLLLAKFLVVGLERTGNNGVKHVKLTPIQWLDLNYLCWHKMDVVFFMVSDQVNVNEGTGHSQRGGR